TKPPSPHKGHSTHSDVPVFSFSQQIKSHLLNLTQGKYNSLSHIESLKKAKNNVVTPIVFICVHSVDQNQNMRPFSTAEYACSRWSRSHHTRLVDTALNDTCRIITGCIKSTPVPCLYALAGIAPPHIRRSIKMSGEHSSHPLHGHTAPPPRLKSRSSFLQTVTPLQTSKESTRTNIWEDKWFRLNTQTQEWTERGITPTECLASGHDLPWPTWKTLKRLHVEQGRCKALMKEWKYHTEDKCSCGAVQTMSHLLECDDAPQCSPKDLAEPTPVAVTCARYW
ncbi:hypothetical protein ABVT39_010174, partial [Epinephelus coioides]